MNKSHHNPSHHKEKEKMGKGKIRPNIWLEEREREQERPQSSCWGTIDGRVFIRLRIAVFEFGSLCVLLE